jgi:hypothetical protein
MYVFGYGGLGNKQFLRSLGKAVPQGYCVKYF